MTNIAWRLGPASNPIRLSVLVLLGDGERTPGDLGADLGLDPTALSRQLAFLRAAGLVRTRREGPRSFYSLTDAGRELRRAVGGLVGDAARRRPKRSPPTA